MRPPQLSPASTSSISHWKVPGALQSTKGITLNWNNPQGIESFMIPWVYFNLPVAILVVNKQVTYSIQTRICPNGKQNAWLVPGFQCKSCGRPNHWQGVTPLMVHQFPCHLSGFHFLVGLIKVLWQWFQKGFLNVLAVHLSDKSVSSILSLSSSVGYDGIKASAKWSSISPVVAAQTHISLPARW